MNTTISLLDWIDSHKVGMWASFMTVIYTVEHAGGLRTILARILGPKQPSGNSGELQPISTPPESQNRRSAEPPAGPSHPIMTTQEIEAELGRMISGPKPPQGGAEQTKKETIA
jgi:hypothetical protein